MLAATKLASWCTADTCEAICQTFGPSSHALLHGTAWDDFVEDPATLAKLKPHRPAAAAASAAEEEGDAWAQLALGANKAYVWSVKGEFSYAVGHLVFERNGQLSRPEGLGFTDGELVSLQRSGNLLLVTNRVGAFPRVYDVSTGQRVWASEEARATVFWPRKGATVPQ